MLRTRLRPILKAAHAITHTVMIPMSDHQRFSQISLNWAGKPLCRLDTILNSIRGTTTSTGLTGRAALLEGTSKKGQKVSAAQVQQLNIEH